MHGKAISFILIPENNLHRLSSNICFWYDSCTRTRYKAGIEVRVPARISREIRKIILTTDHETVQKFQVPDLALRQSLKFVIWAMGLLALFNLVFFAAPFVSFL